jgi:hypothetical protein
MTTMHPSTPKRTLLPAGYGIPLLVAFIVRVGAMTFAHITNPNLWEYGDIAHHLIHGEGYSYTWWVGGLPKVTLPTAFMPPGEVLLQSVGLFLFGDNLFGYIAIYLEQVILAVLFVYLIGRILDRLFSDSRIEKLGLWLAAIYPPFVFAVTTFGVATPVLFLNALLMLCSLRLIERIRSGNGVMQAALQWGVVAGLLGYFRAESPAFVVLTITFIGYRERDLFRKFKSSIVVALIAMVCMLAPWTIRNYQVFHKVIPGSSSGSFNFWRGNHPGATGSSWDEHGQAIWTTDSMWNIILPNGIVEKNIEARYAAFNAQASSEWIKANPVDAFVLAWKKAVLLWGIDWYSAAARTPAYVLIYLPTLGLLIYGCVRLRKSRARLASPQIVGIQLIGLWCIGYTLLVMAFFSLPRIQILLEGLYFPIVVFGVDGLINTWRSKRLAQLSNKV